DKLIAVLCTKLEVTTRPNEVCVALCAQIPQQLVGQANIGEDHTQQLLVELSRTHQPARQYPQSFLHSRYHSRHLLRAGSCAADIDMMRNVHHVADDLIAAEGRRNHEDVREMT